MLSQITRCVNERREVTPAAPLGPTGGRVILFTDVDGTLLDKYHKVGVPSTILRRTFDLVDVVFVSSRTLPELFALQESLSLYGECIAENGGVTASYIPLSDGTPELLPEWDVGGAGLLAVQCLAAPVSETTALVRDIAARNHLPLRLLSDYSLDELASYQQQTRVEAEQSLARRVSVLVDPGVISHPRGATFLSQVRRTGCVVQYGGRWISIVKGADKGTAVRKYLAARRCRGDEIAYTIGIGNEANDTSLLRAVDCPFVVRNPDTGHAAALMQLPNATLLTRIGCDGWTEMADHIFHAISRAT